MSSPLLFALPNNEALSASLSQSLGAQLGELEVRHFPDGESYTRFRTSVRDAHVVLVCTMPYPDEKILPLIFAAGAARNLGAKSVGLVCPYLAYMRQDRRFKDGESVSSNHFATLISTWIDWLVTVDPHLHRRKSLAEIYTIPALCLHAAPLISEWIKANVERPLLIGPDQESEQWVAAAASDAGAAHMILTKVRRGDHDVEISTPEVEKWLGHTPIIVDDIISTATTMIETVKHINKAGLRPPICIGVHGIFSQDAFDRLRALDVERIVTTNSIPHESNLLDITEIVATGIKDSLHYLR